MTAIRHPPEKNTKHPAGGAATIQPPLVVGRKGLAAVNRRLSPARPSVEGESGKVVVMADLRCPEAREWGD